MAAAYKRRRVVANKENIDTCAESLQRVQDFNTSELGRADDLGQRMSFVEAIPLADDLVSLYKRVPLSSLQDFTNQQLDVLKQQANSDYNLFQQILDFDVQSSDAYSRRNSIIENLKSRRDSLFSTIWQFIAYGVARTTDTSLLEAQARATIQSIQDESSRLTQQIENAKNQAESALEAIRAVASEQGVSQQAKYFKDESSEQETLAAKWLNITYGFAAAVGVFALFSLLLHKIPFIAPTSTGEMLQLVSSKILIFSVLGYMLIMSARNYSTHKHNAVVNRHRQNALLTYRAIVSAAGEQNTHDIILAHASSCIFSPQETGFSSGKGDGFTGSKAVLELMTKGASSKSTSD